MLLMMIVITQNIYAENGHREKLSPWLRQQCTVAEHASKRAEIKALLRQLRAVNPAVDMNIFRSMENVNLKTLISYHKGAEYHHFLDDYHDGTSNRGK